MSSYQTYQTYQRQQQEDLVREHLPLVYGTARRIANATGIGTLEMGDLVNAGVIGLYRAMDKFDASIGVPFGGYAFRFVRGAMLDEVRRHRQVPRSIGEKQAKLKRAHDALSQRLLRMPSDEEVAEHVGISMDELNDWYVDVGWTTVWSVEELEETGPVFAVDEDEMVNPDMTVDAKERSAILAQALRKLTDKEQRVLYLYYEEELTLKEIGYILDLSESQISKIHSKCVLRLRGMLARKKSDLVTSS